MDIKSLENELLKLSPREKAAIPYKLLESIENDGTGNLEEIWAEEALKRYYDIRDNKKGVIDGDLVIREAKLKYK